MHPALYRYARPRTRAALLHVGFSLNEPPLALLNLKDISVDAPTPAELKAVDRPLFPDFWERFLASIDALRRKDLLQRTVFRMTLVKQFNMDTLIEAERYADLIRRGQPDFIEIKSVTFCGVSDGSNLTMKNVPITSIGRGVLLSDEEVVSGLYVASGMQR